MTFLGVHEEKTVFYRELIRFVESSVTQLGVHDLRGGPWPLEGSMAF